MKLSRPLAVTAVSASAVLLPVTGTARAADVPALPVTGDDHVECSGEGGDIPVTVEVTDGPDIVVPGGWDELAVRWTNTGEEPLVNLYTYADLWAHPAEDDGVSWPVDIEWRAPDGWRDVVFETDLAAGHFAVARDVRPGDGVEVRLRVRVDEAPPGYAEVGLGSMSVSGEADCLRGEDARLTYPVEASSTRPGPTLVVTPEPGGTELAETGRESSVPLVATTAALTVAAGAGVVLTSYRRRPRSDG
ncbi:hypothetical protein [Streptomyces avicenniae]|uniref:hypothetical protein n=1 Tax=Streptomyces avicenniae TaxID=500153 RepID=UPI0006998EDA|nr:hypothetical protein [Streptomyces avicenniae]